MFFRTGHAILYQKIKLRNLEIERQDMKLFCDNCDSVESLVKQPRSDKNAFDPRFIDSRLTKTPRSFYSARFH